MFLLLPIQLLSGGFESLKLPEPITSFGACRLGKYLYVYGGHTGEAHVYSEKTHSLHFVRTDLSKAAKWEKLPFKRPLQGFGMAAHKGKVYLAGGSQATNPEGEKSNLSSVAEVSVYDPASGKWSQLTPLPEPRSSHELVAHKGKLYVVGGWNMQEGKGVDWHRHGLVADLKDDPVEWKRLPETEWKVRANSVRHRGELPIRDRRAGRQRDLQRSTQAFPQEHEMV